MRLIRFRRKARKKVCASGRSFRLVPAWLRWTVATLYVLAIVIATYVNLDPRIERRALLFHRNSRNNPALASPGAGGNRHVCLDFPRKLCLPDRVRESRRENAAA